MRLLIWHKLFLALLAAAALVALITLLLTRLSFSQGFLAYLNAIEEQRIGRLANSLAQIHAEGGNWDGLLQNPRLWRELMDQYAGRSGRDLTFQRPRLDDTFSRPGSEHSADATAPAAPSHPKLRHDPQFADNGPLPHMAPHGTLGLAQPIDLLAADGAVLIGRPDDMPGARQIAITDARKVVGYLRYLPVNQLTDLDALAEQQFIEQQQTGLYLITAIALGIAAIIAWALGMRLVAPIRDLAAGTAALVAGQPALPIKISSKDELGQLAYAFNSMVNSLAEAKLTQQQWIADIAHELRTPLAILSGELHAIEDGIRDWNEASRASLRAEISRLSQLVDDLHEVSLSDAGGLGYQHELIELNSIIEHAVDLHRGRIAECGLTVEAELTAINVLLLGDRRRLVQVFSNLLENSCRYTNVGGRVRIRCEADDIIIAHVEDTAPAPPQDALPKLFDRLYRVDESRNRAQGGSGLGLAICKGIITAHGGTISASRSSLGGLDIKLELPRAHA